MAEITQQPETGSLHSPLNFELTDGWHTKVADLANKIKNAYNQGQTTVFINLVIDNRTEALSITKNRGYDIKYFNISGQPNPDTYSNVLSLIYELSTVLNDSE